MIPEKYAVASAPEGLSLREAEALLLPTLEGTPLRRVLIIPPDHTRLHSLAGPLTVAAYRFLVSRGTTVKVLPALGTHAPMTKDELDEMYPGIPGSDMLVHDWRNGVRRIGQVSAEYMRSITDGLWTEPVDAEVSEYLFDGWDRILSIGQVVPHEVIGMSNHAKNLFVGAGGSSMINSSHMVGAVYGMERIMGRDHSPVRKLFDHAAENFLKDLPIQWVLTVTTETNGSVHLHGLFTGPGRECLTRAIALSQEKNIVFTDRGFKKCVVYLDENEFKSTWLGNKAIYRTRMAMEDDGELIILAPGVRRFGEDDECDRLIRKYGYRGRVHTLEQFRANDDLRRNMSAAAHLIHGSSDGRFRVRYAVSRISREEIEGVGYLSADCDELLRRYDPATLTPGFNTLPDGEEIFFVPNPALGLWIDRKRFTE